MTTKDEIELRGLRSGDVWNYENGYWWFSDVSRFAKSVAHAELYRTILDLPGDVAEFGVYKAASLIRWASLRDMYEATRSRRIVGFDAFGKFPEPGGEELAISDRLFVTRFEEAGGDGLLVEEIRSLLEQKGLSNVELVSGDVRATLPTYLERRDASRFSLVHLDMDVYAPTKFVLDRIFERVVVGGLLVIDDYNAVAGASQAVDEFADAHGLKVEKLGVSHVPSFIRKLSRLGVTGASDLSGV